MKSILTLFFLLWATSAYGQNAATPVKISVGNEATAVPFSQIVTSPIHPALQVGTEFDWRESDHFRLYPTVNIGYMFHKNLFQGLYINGELGFDVKFDFGLSLKSALGIGYLHTFTTQDEYQFKNGRYVNGRDKGNSRFMPSFTVGLGYRLQPGDYQSTELFLLYQSWLEYPYSPGFIPLMSHTNLQFGSKFYPFK